MYFTKKRVNLYRFVPIFTIFMFLPLQKKFFLTDKILKNFFLQKSLLPCEKHITKTETIFFVVAFSPFILLICVCICDSSGSEKGSEIF